MGFFEELLAGPACGVGPGGQVAHLGVERLVEPRVVLVDRVALHEAVAGRGPLVLQALLLHLGGELGLVLRELDLALGLHQLVELFLVLAGGDVALVELRHQRVLLAGDVGQLGFGIVGRGGDQDRLRLGSRLGCGSFNRCRLGCGGLCGGGFGLRLEFDGGFFAAAVIISQGRALFVGQAVVKQGVSGHGDFSSCDLVDGSRMGMRILSTEHHHAHTRAGVLTSTK